MTYEEHLIETGRFISDSFMLRQRGSGMLAAEAVWGAAIQAMAAVEHARNPSSRRHPQQERFIINLLRQHNLPPNLRQGFIIIRDRLHNHFYTGQLDTLQFSEYMDRGNVFVRQLLEIAERIRNLG